ncbi:leucyl/phenylalanyl-tRNA--protein transferase [Sediminivirga luteola]|uniref:Leucyl/phenylalanyl-tRNA--protein transferase n=1 Tax=Sediminivirga luteola TaxID=1774748 RepID=A0A8J2U017_9MICO|nr:leucyl/phenylalanyl-tRNA--protein transferase [Sediminivirga luteola]GGA22805.1 leucyl/phenylalanyl-tRNA--protein transferase [Sediminivirga luteola]
MAEDLSEIRALTARLDPAQVLSAYRAGLFPMGLGEQGAPPYAWWAPEYRGVLLPGRLKVSASLARSVRRFDYTVDRAFGEVIRACADPSREGGWIDAGIIDVYTRLHEQGWAHSVEVWHEGRLVGGLYGIGMGSFFAGESMFHRARDASKAALVELVRILEAQFGNIWLIDTQWSTPHLASLGVSELHRWDYLPRMHAAIAGGDSRNSHNWHTPQMNFYAP